MQYALITLHALNKHVAEALQDAKAQIIAATALVGICHAHILHHNVERHTCLLLHLREKQTHTALKRYEVERLLNGKLHKAEGLTEEELEADE